MKFLSYSKVHSMWGTSLTLSFFFPFPGYSAILPMYNKCTGRGPWHFLCTTIALRIFLSERAVTKLHYVHFVFPMSRYSPK